MRRIADITLSAGPTPIEAPTLAAMGAPMPYHYDPAFLEEYRAIEEAVGRTMHAGDCDVVLLQGEAVLGLEAAWRALVRPGMSCLNLVSGPFGKGMGAWLRAGGATVHQVEVDYRDAVRAEQVEEAHERYPEVELLALVHSETPCGTLNPAEQIGPLARSRGVVTLVDCVSSVAGMPFQADGWQLDVCVAGAQKCLAGPPGISMLTVSPQAWDLIARNPEAPRGSYLSLLDWKERWIDGGHFPFTPSISDVRGLGAACRAFLEEGEEAAFARHQLAAGCCREGARAMGLELWPVRDEVMSTCVTAVKLPDGLDDLTVRQHIRERYGVMLSGGHGAGRLMRIGHMGAMARSLYPLAGLAALGRGLADLGADVRVGEGLERALAIMSEGAPG